MKEWEWTWNRDGTEHLITVKEEGDCHFTVWADDDRVASVTAGRGSWLSRTTFGTDELVPLFGSELRLTVARRFEENILKPRADFFENGYSLRDGSTLAERREKLRAAVRREARLRWILSAVWLLLSAFPASPLFGFGLAVAAGTAVPALIRSAALNTVEPLPEEPGNELSEAKNASS